MPLDIWDDDLNDLSIGIDSDDFEPRLEIHDRVDPWDIGRGAPRGRPAIERHDVPGGRARGLDIWAWERADAHPGRGQGRGLTMHEPGPPDDRPPGRRR